MNYRMQQLGSLVRVLMAVGAFSAGAGLEPDAAARYRFGKCKPRISRNNHTQGQPLWGTKQTWIEGAPVDVRASVLVSARLCGKAGAMQLQNGRLMGESIASSVLEGETSSGQPVEVVICSAEPSPKDPDMVWYWIEAWNPVAQDWENPCVAKGEANPRALALAGTWDATGAHHADARRITFACEGGALSKCADWGYKPWASRDGRSLADAHQACTRMVRADYCGDGTPHTEDGRRIDYYADPFGIAEPTTGVSREWNPAQASFEAAWDAEGAVCMATMRNGRDLAPILKECPDRFRASTADLGQGDRCVVQRATVKDPAAASVLRNRSILPPSPDESLPVRTGHVTGGHDGEGAALIIAPLIGGSQFRDCSLSRRQQPGTCFLVGYGPVQDSIREGLNGRAAF